MNKSGQVFEILKWKSKTGVADEQMIAAVDAMLMDVKHLKGFLHQTLYKNSDNEWVDIYYWETEKDAHDFNAGMADKNSFKELIELIEVNTISIEVLHPLQTSGKQVFVE